MIMSVSTLIRFIGAATPSRVVNFSMSLTIRAWAAPGAASHAFSTERSR
jgi:hypothetical protein